MDYRYIRAWCQMMKCFDYYTQAELKRARESKAPDDACYWSDREGRWITFKDIESPHTVQVLEQIIEGFK